MAITAATLTSDFTGFLNPEQSAPIFDDAQRQSAFQQLFRRVPLGATGTAIPYVATKPVANWVSEGQKKPATAAGMDLITLEPKKLAAIAVMSAEVVRANPGRFTDQLRTELAGAFATAFDYAVGYDLGGDGTGSGPFDAALDDTTKEVELGTAAQADGGIHADIVDGLRQLVDDGKRLTGFALADALEPELLSAVDANGRPLYVDLPTDSLSQAVARPGRLIGRPSYMGEGVGNGDVVAFGGDFSKGVWGAVGGISYRVSTEAAVTINGALVSLFENNLVAVLAEAEYGFGVVDVEHYVKYTLAAS